MGVGWKWGRGRTRRGGGGGSLDTRIPSASLNSSDTRETTCTEDDTDSVTWSDTDGTHLAL